MNTQNITLAIPKDVLHNARRLAVERRTSLSALVTQVITEMVERDERYRAACERQLAILGNGFNLNTQGRATWTRQELHER